jgi:DNA polymerase-3 subunit gamma/tau
MREKLTDKTDDAEGAYHTKYRPRSFETVVGQTHVLPSLQRVLDKGTSQAYLFAGPSGTGKTTLSRIAAAYLGATPRDIVDVDAATYTGIDKTRELMQVMQYRPIGGGDIRAVILDECHRLSGQAWDSLLKTLEQPNPSVFWFLCTTNLGKVPRTVQTRCTAYTLQDVSESDIEKLVRRVMKKEGIKLSDGVIQLMCREAHGSPRQALSFLATCEGAADTKEAAQLIKAVQESDGTIQLCQLLLKGGSWPRAMSIYEKLKEENPEGVRIVVVNYMGKVLAGCKSDDKAIAMLQIIEAFSAPYNPSEGATPLLMSIGRALFAGGE